MASKSLIMAQSVISSVYFGLLIVCLYEHLGGVGNCCYKWCERKGISKPEIKQSIAVSVG